MPPSEMQDDSNPAERFAQVFKPGTDRLVSSTVNTGAFEALAVNGLGNLAAVFARGRDRHNAVLRLAPQEDQPGSGACSGTRVW